MEQTNAEERKLYTAVIDYVEAVERMYASQLLEQEEAMERKLRAVRRAKKIAGLVVSLAMYGSMEENVADATITELTHSIRVRMDRNELTYDVGRERTPQQ